MAASQLDYGSNHHWVPARSYRFSPYPLPQYAAGSPEQTSPAMAPPLHIPQASHRHFQEHPERYVNGGWSMDAAADGRVFVPSLGAPSSSQQGTVYASMFDTSPTFLSPHSQENDPQERKSASTCDESPTEPRTGMVRRRQFSDELESVQWELSCFLQTKR